MRSSVTVQKPEKIQEKKPEKIQEQKPEKIQDLKKFISLQSCQEGAVSFLKRITLRAPATG